MARKVIESTKIGDKSFQTERQNLEQFKDCLSKNENIMMSFATFVRGTQFNIVSRLADMDLHQFLHGTYREFPQLCTRFTPEALFEEAWCLASALNFLHEELKTRQRKISCAHMDLKPENILVQQLVTTPSPDRVVGKWMISDFGIATIKPLDAEALESLTSKEQQLAPGDIIQDRSIDPPRGPGPYQAPEMQQHKGLRVSKSSDMWSFGCIIAMILAFAIGGPEMVRELRESRKIGYEDDYFYMEGPPAKVKPEIIEWLGHLAENENLKEHWQWIKDCQSLVEDLLVIPKDSRPSAGRSGTRLLKIRENIGKIQSERQRMWGAPTQQQLTIHLPTPERDASNSSNSTQNSEASEERLAPIHPTPPRQSLTTHDELQSAQVPIKPSVVAQSSSFVRLEAPLNVQKACLSSCGRRAAFLSENLIYLYQLDNLYDEPAPWKSKMNKNRVSKESMAGFEMFGCSEPRQWTSIFLAGSYCAVASISKENNEDMVLFKPLIDSDFPQPCINVLTNKAES